MFLTILGCVTSARLTHNCSSRLKGLSKAVRNDERVISVKVYKDAFDERSTVKIQFSKNNKKKLNVEQTC